MATYTYKGKKYTFQQEVMMKCHVSRKWLPAVQYLSWDTEIMYVREREDFYNKFKQWTPDMPEPVEEEDEWKFEVPVCEKCGALFKTFGCTKDECKWEGKQ